MNEDSGASGSAFGIWDLGLSLCQDHRASALLRGGTGKVEAPRVGIKNTFQIPCKLRGMTSHEMPCSHCLGSVYDMCYSRQVSPPGPPRAL